MTLQNKSVTKLTCLLVLTAGLGSCDEIFELQESKAPLSVTVDREELYLMEGDTCTLSAELSGTYNNPLVYWTSIDPSFAKVLSDGSVVALHEGDARIVVMSISDTEVRDTATVHIIKVPDVNEALFRYDMPVYASVIDDDNAKNSRRRIMAYSGDELRGTSELLTLTDDSGTRQECFLIRVFSNSVSGDVLSFRYYNSRIGSILTLKETLSFDQSGFIGYPSDPVIFTVRQ